MGENIYISQINLYDRLMSIQASMQAEEAVEKVMQQHNKDANVSTKLLLAGALAGAISKSATAPLARITILNQVQGAHATGRVGGSSMASVRSMSVGETIRTIVRREGLGALWKGNGVTLVHRLPYSASNFYIYEMCRKQLKERRNPSAGEDNGCATVY